MNHPISYCNDTGVLLKLEKIAEVLVTNKGMSFFWQFLHYILFSHRNIEKYKKSLLDII